MDPNHHFTGSFKSDSVDSSLVLWIQFTAGCLVLMCAEHKSILQVVKC